jgi:hypothetical protein
MLSRFNVPIMGINAITQILVQPPKYTVDRLVPCRLGSTTRVEELFVIERGTPGIRDLDHETTLQRMIENTDDAYGFPRHQGYRRQQEKTYAQEKSERSQHRLHQRPGPHPAQPAEDEP